MGAYPGHHGILSNTFWDRERWLIAPQHALSTLLADPQATNELKIPLQIHESL